MNSDVQLLTKETRQWLFNLWRAAGSNELEARLTAEHLIGAHLAGHDSHGVIIGTDNYAKMDVEYPNALVESLNLPAADLQKILYGNAARLIKLG